jgi:transcriptional regulator with XRE-family HTH domain
MLLDTKDLYMVRSPATLGHPMNELPWHVGDVVRKLRQKRGWNQSELAAAAGVHKNTVARIEDGDEGVTGKTLKAVALALETTLAQIYGLIPEDKGTPVTGTTAETLAATGTGGLQRPSVSSVQSGQTNDRRNVSLGPPSGLSERRR